VEICCNNNKKKKKEEEEEEKKKKKYKAVTSLSHRHYSYFVGVGVFPNTFLWDLGRTVGQKYLSFPVSHLSVNAPYTSVTHPVFVTNQ
jgi:hypothetical protein